MKQKLFSHAAELLRGAYDLHVHTALDYRPRSVDDIDLLKEAEQYQMRGVLIKNHYEPTQARAYLANQHAQTEAQAYGSIVLNNTVGGLNPYAVENSLRQGAKMVWMPTMDSALCSGIEKIGQQFEKRRGISIYDAWGRLDPAIPDLLELVKQYDVPIATGHMDAKESIDFCRLALDAKARIIFTHPDWKRSRIPLAQQIELARAGVLIEKVFWYLEPEEICQSAREIGFEHTFVVSDRGQVGQDTPVQSMLHYCAHMLEYGLTDKEIRTMIVDVPKEIIGV